MRLTRGPKNTFCSANFASFYNFLLNIPIQNFTKLTSLQEQIVKFYTALPCFKRYFEQITRRKSSSL